MIKECNICGQTFETVKNGGSRQSCYDCIPLDATNNNRATYRRAAMKREGVKRLGGKCIKCGISKKYLLNFHHLRPENKNDNPANILANNNVAGFFEEIQDCVLLCSNCHTEFHHLEHSQNITLQEYLDDNYIEEL